MRGRECEQRRRKNMGSTHAEPGVRVGRGARGTWCAYGPGQGDKTGVRQAAGGGTGWVATIRRITRGE
jgi:hypothetical protein